MRGGLLVYFGDAARPHAKWTALARVLADPSSAGASYIDVRLPERPAAGFSAGSAPSASAVSTTGQASTPESTVSALAEGLTAITGGGSSAGGGTTSASAATPAAGSAANDGSLIGGNPGSRSGLRSDGIEIDERIGNSSGCPAPGG